MPKGRGRPVPTRSRLGRIVARSEYKVFEICGKTGIHNRLMTEYLAGRKVIIPDHVTALCNVLGCSPVDIIEPNLKHDLTDKMGVPIDPAIPSVKDLDMSHLEPYIETKDIPEADSSFRTAHKPVVAPERLIRKAV
jgi:DNA-binding Xre family transcriptional regulator